MGENTRVHGADDEEQIKDLEMEMEMEMEMDVGWNRITARIPRMAHRFMRPE